jgi:hypothetical protein
MKKFLITGLIAVAGIAQATSISTTQRLIDDNFEPRDCGKVIKIADRNGGGKIAICSNREVFMLTGNSKFPLIRCSALDRTRAQGHTNFPTTRECRGF